MGTLSLVGHLLLTLFFNVSAIATGILDSQWTLVQPATSGVAAMQLTMVSPTLALIIDRVETNPLQIDGHPAWSALYNLETNNVTAVNVVSNSFCAGGTFLSNGTLANVGGSAVAFPQYDDVSGFQGIRLFDPCNDPIGEGCVLFDDPTALHLAKPRWYPTTIRIWDGSALILGGTSTPGFYSSAVNGTNSIEFFPPKDGGVPRPSSFLVRSLPAILFPFAFALPDKRVLMIANNQTIIYDVSTNQETPLPPLPNGVRVSYPFTGSGVLLPLSPPSYTPEVLICGGSNYSDSLLPAEMSSQKPASSQCSRLTLTPDGIARGWQVEQMLEGRTMPETVLLPSGEIVIINGGKTGVSSFASVPDSPGSGNADNPAFTPSLYHPSAPLGQRFSNKQMPTSSIARMYHSVASLTPNGNIMVAGSNPNFADVNTTIAKYPTEYRVEFLNPPYMFVDRPLIAHVPDKIGFNQRFSFSVQLPATLKGHESVKVSLMDLGYTTHATHCDGRLVFLEASLSHDSSLITVTGPPNAGVYPPGPGYIFLTVNGVSSKGVKVMVGTGANPPISD